MSLFTIGSATQAELIIKKSKFVAFLIPILTENELKEKLACIKKDYSDSTHICYAYIINPNIEKCYDDNEPTGTAGLPMLTFLKHNKLTNVLAVVVRYYGGIKLGAGGLIRAYKNAVNLAFEKSQLIVFKSYENFIFELNYDEINGFLENKQNYYQVNSIIYNEKVEIILAIEKDKVELFKQNFPHIKLSKKEE